MWRVTSSLWYYITKSLNAERRQCTKETTDRKKIIIICVFQPWWKCNEVEKKKKNHQLLKMVEGKFEFVAVHHALATIGLIEIFEKKKKKLSASIRKFVNVFTHKLVPVRHIRESSFHSNLETQIIFYLIKYLDNIPSVPISIDYPNN